MSAREIEPRTGFAPTINNSHPPPPHSSPSSSSFSSSSSPAPQNGASNGMGSASSQTAYMDIGEFVSKYNKMMEYLHPLELVGKAILHIVRWENYFLTLLCLTLLCVLFYHPALLAVSIVGSAIVGMAVGKYYSQTKLSVLFRRRDDPQVVLLDSEYQALKKTHKQEKASHKLLLEYRQIICSTEVVITMATKALDYVYRIIFWKSLEVSLCVTVLLCVLLALPCVIQLRALSASLPFLFLCINRHFIRRTVQLWKSLFRHLYRLVQFRKRASHSGAKDKTEEESRSAEVVHHEEPLQMNGINAASSEPEEGQSSRQQQTSTTASAAAARSGNGVTEGGAADREGAGSLSYSKGFCYKCNASFAKLLKRKHDCSSCGQSFCGSCTVKVKRAVLGATSPAAFEESVRVCVDCKTLLDELKPTG